MLINVNTEWCALCSCGVGEPHLFEDTELINFEMELNTVDSFLYCHSTMRQLQSNIPQIIAEINPETYEKVTKNCIYRIYCCWRFRGANLSLVYMILKYTKYSVHKLSYWYILCITLYSLSQYQFFCYLLWKCTVSYVEKTTIWVINLFLRISSQVCRMVTKI